MVMEPTDMFSMFQHVESRSHEIKEREKRGALPVMRGKLPNKTDLTFIHRQQLAQSINNKSANTCTYATTMAAPITHGVAPESHEGLKPISLAEAVTEVNKIHKGRVLYVTVIAPPSRAVAVALLVEDSRGACMLLQLYNYVPIDVAPNDVLPEGTRLAVMEPYLRFPRDQQENPPCIRCDNPQAIHVLPPTENEYPQDDATALCERANRAFSAKQFVKALGLYDRALERADGAHSAIRARVLNNRGQVYAQTGRWAAALRDSEAALDLDQAYAKSAFRRALSLLMLQRPEEALQAVKNEALDGCAERDVSKLRSDIDRGIGEKQRGEFDISALIREARTSAGQISRRHCDYESSDIAVKAISGKGRGVISQKALTAGTLIMAAKAFAYDVPDGQKIGMVMRFTENSRIDTDSMARLLPRVVQAVIEHPESSAEMYSLSAGEQFSGIPVPSYAGAVDVRRLDAILHTNWFGMTDCTTVPSIVKVERWTTKTGSLLPRGKEMQELAEFTETAKSKQEHGTGLWVRPSLFNHSCMPNCVYVNVGDFMLISTTRSVAEGEELCVSYLDPMMPFNERTEKLSNWNSGNGFTCECDRCIACRRDPRIGKLEEEAIAVFQRAAQLSPLVSMRERAAKVKISSKSRSLLDTLPERDVAMPLALVLEIEAGSLMSSARFKEAVPVYERCFELRSAVLGNGGTVDFVRDLIRLAFANVLADKKEAARLAIKAAFAASCLPNWRAQHMSVFDFNQLVYRFQMGHSAESAEYAVKVCLGLVVDVYKASGGKADMNPRPFCALCTEEAPKMLRCSKCHDERYCSREHQKKHWKIHRQVCCK